MGTGVLSGPGAQLTVDGTTYDTGKIELASAVGVQWTRTPGSPVLYTPSSAVGDVSAPPSLFLPGLLAAADPLAVFTPINAYGEERLQLLELNLRVAPTGATGVNNLAVRVSGTGAGSGTIVLPMDGSGDNAGLHYASDYRVGSNVGAQSNAQGGFSAGAFLMPFKMSANATVGAVGLTWGTNSNGPGSQGADHAKTYQILDANLNVLAQSAPFYGAVSQLFQNPAPFDVKVPLTAAVNLQANTNYYLSVLTDSAFVDGFHPLVIGGTSGNPPTFTGNFIATAQAFNVFLWRSTTTVLSSWKSYYGANNPQVVGGDANVTAFGGNTLLSFGLFGGATAALIRGQIHVGLVSQGLGPTTPGNDLNLRMMWAYQ